MRTSQFFLKTAKESPHDAEIISHQLMLRAGMIKRLGSGLYTWLPLGLRVLRKVETIVREEMNRAGALELFMPAIQPAELWQETGRWDSFGGQLLKMTDNAERAYCFGPTHEEVITDIMRHELNSYKQLPLNFYQIQTKFRDEIRPRFGVMRAREFLMKDAYSFHLDKESLAETYQIMYDAYGRIFTRLGLQFRAVEADTGAIGGFASHEFQVLAETGEDLIFYSDESDYAANIEQANYLIAPTTTKAKQDGFEKVLVDTPNVTTIAQLSESLGVCPQNTVKTLIVAGEHTPLVALVIRGDHELNPIKAARHPLVQEPLRFIDEMELKTHLDLEPGCLGPIDLNIPTLVDHSAHILSDFICGANQNGKHYRHVFWQRDAQYDEVADLRNVVPGDLSPDGQGRLKQCRGIEVGHVFQLGDKYAQAMNATVLNKQGKACALMMGCYGIGISRIVGAAIEQNHDQHGIIWPSSMAPFQIHLVPMNYHKSEAVKQQSDQLYHRLQEQGYDVLFDDRNERAGTLFADGELVGIPHRLVVSDKTLAADSIEYKPRCDGEKRLIKLGELCHFLRQVLYDLKTGDQKCN